MFRLSISECFIIGIITTVKEKTDINIFNKVEFICLNNSCLLCKYKFAASTFANICYSILKNQINIII